MKDTPAKYFRELKHETFGRGVFLAKKKEYHVKNVEIRSEYVDIFGKK